MPVILLVDIPTEMKPRFIAKENQRGVCFSSIHPIEAPVYKLEACFMSCVTSYGCITHVFCVLCNGVEYLEWNMFLKYVSYVCKLLR
jgi:hypothetical protein